MRFATMLVLSGVVLGALGLSPSGTRAGSTTINVTVNPYGHHSCQSPFYFKPGDVNSSLRLALRLSDWSMGQANRVAATYYGYPTYPANMYPAYGACPDSAYSPYACPAAGFSGYNPYVYPTAGSYPSYSPNAYPPSGAYCPGSYYPNISPYYYTQPSYTSPYGR